MCSSAEMWPGALHKAFIVENLPRPLADEWARAVIQDLRNVQQDLLTGHTVYTK